MGRQIELIARERQSLAQRIYYLTLTKEFQDYYDSLNREERAHLEMLAATLNLEQLKSKVVDHTKHLLETKTIRDLREIASDLGVPSYTRLSKDELLIEITQVQNALRTPQIIK